MNKIKHCSHCKTIYNLPENPYCKNINKDGIITSVCYMCRSCNALRSRKYRHTDKGKEVFRDICKRQYTNHKKRILAYANLNHAIKVGKVIRPNKCSLCGIECIPDGHHQDYNKQLDVIWVCRSCHSKL